MTWMFLLICVAAAVYGVVGTLIFVSGMAQRDMGHAFGWPSEGPLMILGTAVFWPIFAAMGLVLAAYDVWRDRRG